MAQKLAPQGKFSEGTHYILRGPETATELVVLVHGMKTYHTCFNRLATVLSGQGFLTLQYDMIGRGFSDPAPNGKYGDDEHVQQLYGLIDRLDLPRKLHMIGHSQGGAVAVIFSSRNWKMIKSITLLAPAGLMNAFPLGLIRHAPLIRMALKSSQRGKEGREKAWRSDFHSHDGVSLLLEDDTVADLHALYESRPQVFEGYFSSLMEFPLSGIEPHISQVGESADLRVLLLWGREDKAVAFKPHFYRWVNELSNTHCHFESRVIEKAGHGMMIEKHEEVNQAILAFLREQ